MILHPPRPTRTDTRFPYSTHFRSVVVERLLGRGCLIDDEPPRVQRVGEDRAVDGVPVHDEGAQPDQRIERPLDRALRTGGEGKRHPERSEEHTSELQSLMRISYAVFCVKKKTNRHKHASTYR